MKARSTIPLPARSLLVPGLIVALAASAIGVAPVAAGDATGTTLEIVSLSNRADVVSGNDVLLEVRVPAGHDPRQVRVEVGGRDVTDVFDVRPDGRLAGLVAGLELGENVVLATSGDRRAELVLTNHPIGGPVFSGPQIQPWYCLPGALDEQCNRPIRHEWWYRTTNGAFAAYDPANPPDDVATTTTDEGEAVPYIVRLEIGNQDRSEYRIAVLTTPEEEWTRWEGGPGAWNNKVYVLHGAGCDAGHSETAAPDVLNDTALRRGFAVMSTALIHNTENCNLVVQAESLMMAKEHLVETYGDIRYLFGQGGSGGAIAQLHIANAYPGLYDGLTVGATFPDLPINDVLDCEALQRYFDAPQTWAPGVVWTETSMAAATGKASSSVCRTWSMPTGPTAFAEIFNPISNQFGARFQCDVPGVNPEAMYHPVNNPGGVRCSIQDYFVNVLGSRPAPLWGPVEQGLGRGFANRPYDNVGVQYGLRGLMAGTILPAQFVDLNAKVGAVDIDFGTQPERAAADPDAVATVYRSGFLNEANHLDRVAIIDLPGSFPGDNFEIHDIYKSWALRERLDNANGHHDNHALWYGPEQRNLDHFGTMDAWLSAIEQDTRDVPREQKVVDNRPAAAADRCEIPNRATCDLLFGPAAYSVRWGAGGSIATDVVKCQLKPLDRLDYAPIVFTDAEWTRLEQAFPTGVCDWTVPGVGQQGAVAWQTYADGPGGQPLGQVPASREVGTAG